MPASNNSDFQEMEERLTRLGALHEGESNSGTLIMDTKMESIPVGGLANPRCGVEATKSFAES